LVGVFVGLFVGVFFFFLLRLGGSGYVCRFSKVRS